MMIMQITKTERANVSRCAFSRCTSITCMCHILYQESFYTCAQRISPTWLGSVLICTCSCYADMYTCDVVSKHVITTKTSLYSLS